MSTSLAADLRGRLTAALRDNGALSSSRWAEAFSVVPRHELVPEFFIPVEDGGTWRRLSDGDGNEWLRRAYADEALVTRLEGLRPAAGQDRPGGLMTGVPVSSSSAPSLMARMLEALDAASTSRVLELGTGTGYNTALLCCGLGCHQVTSIDIDPELTAQARQRLAGLGMGPLLISADGDTRVGMHPRHDRLIVTYGVPRIPPGWLSLLNPGGVIVAPLYRELSPGAMLRLTVTGPGSAAGRFLPFYGAFMPTRTRQGPSLAAAMADAAARGPGRPAGIAELGTAGSLPWQDFAALVLPDMHLTGVLLDGTSDPARRQLWLTASDGSWACQQSRQGKAPVVTQGGPRRLWDELEAARAQWHELGEPPREKLGLTVTTDKHELWIDVPSHVIASV
jgi:protein-L-isoaspartate O-methyltransferase